MDKDTKTALSQIRSEVNKLKHRLDEFELRYAPREQDPTRIKPHNDPSKEHDPANGQTTAKAKTEPTPEKASNPYNPWYNTLHGWKAVLEIVAIPFAIAYAVVTYLQWRDLNKNFVLDQRAWVGYVDTTEFVLRIGEQPTVRHWFMNTGKTPALDFKARMGALFLPPSEEFSAQYGIRTVRIPISNAQIMPGQKTMFAPVEESPITPTALSIDALRSSRLTLYLFGEACYKDIFGGQHHTTFCEVVAPDLTNIVNCKTYNQQDDDPANNCPNIK